MAIINEQAEVQSRLTALGTSRDELLEVIKMSVGARRGATPDDPAFTGGMLAYIYGTRGLRLYHCRRGWKRCRTDNIESVYNPATGDKIVFQNAERAGDPFNDPVAISKKGPAATRAVAFGQYEMFPEIREAEVRELTARHWYMFVEVAGDGVRAELSFPKAIEDDEFSGFNERIFLLQKGDWEGIDLSVDLGPDLDFDVDVTRKH